MSLGILLLFTSALQAAPLVLVSIKPLYGLTAYLMQGIGEPALLLPDNASPHVYAFKPSDREKLARAELFVFIDYEMESFLKPKQVATIPHVLQLSKLPSLHAIPTRGPKHTHDHEHEHEHEHDHDAHGHDHEHHHTHGATDWHIWLDPNNAKIISEAIAAQLVTLDPSNATRYQDNLTQLLKELTALDLKLQTELSPIRQSSFMVYHDAYQYFATHYQLKLPAVLHWQPEAPITPKQLGAIQTQITTEHITCLFLEPQFDNPRILQFGKQLGLSIHQLDPLGSDLPRDKNLYFQLLQNLSTALTGCLVAS